MHLKIIFLLFTCYQLTECKPYLNTRRLSFGEQMTWRFGGWKPMVPTSNGLRPEDNLSGFGSLSISNNNDSLNLNNNLNNNNINSNSNNNNANLNSNFNNVIYNHNNNSANGVVQSGRNATSSSNSNLSPQRGSPNPIGLSSSAPLKSSLVLPVPTSLTSGSPLSSSQSGSLAAPDSSESHLSPKYRNLVDIEQVKMDDMFGKGFPGSSGPSNGPASHGLYGPPMGHSFGKPGFGYPGFTGIHASSLKGNGPLLLPRHLSYLGRGLPVPGSHLGPRPNRVEGKPMKDAELHAYRMIKQLKERGRDIRKDFGIVDAFPVNRGLYPKVTTGEGGKRYVTVPVAIETDHDKVLTQNDIKDIEKEVLKIIPEVEHGLVEGAVKDGARVIELRPEGGSGEKGGRSINRPPITVTSPSSNGRIPGHSSVISGPSPIIYDNLAANPIKSRISSIFRPLLSKFRQPGRSPPAFGGSDPKNLNVIHLIAHQERLPSIVPVDRLAQRPDMSKNNNGNQGGHHQQMNNQRFPMAHGPINPPMSNLQYKIIHPHNNNQGQGKPSFIEYHPGQGLQNGKSGEPQGSYDQEPGHVNGPHQSPQSPPYQVIEVPQGYDVSPDHIIENQPQVVPIGRDQLVDLKANQYNQGDESQPNHGPTNYNQGSPSGPSEFNNRPTGNEGYSEPPYPTTGSPGYTSGNYENDENKQDGPSNQAYGNNNNENHGYDEQQPRPQDNYDNGENTGTDYSNPLGPEYNLNAHSGQIERPNKDYSQEENDENRGRVNEEEDKGHRPTMIPSVDYAEPPKIELLNGASPDFSPKPYTTPSELDTKMLINLISNQIPSLGNVLKDAEPIKDGPQANYGDNHQQGYGPNDQGPAYVSSPSYEGQNGDKNYNNNGESSGQDYGSSGNPKETFTEAAVNPNEPRFGDRIRGQEVVYAKAEHYDDQNYQSNSHSSQGIYPDSSNSQEVRVKSNSSMENNEETTDDETYTFVKLDSRNEPINGKVIFGDQSNNTSDKLETSESTQQYHAYHGSADHVPPPGYIKLSDKEFKELFKDADIHYSKDGESSDPLSSSPSETSPSTVALKGTIDKTTVDDNSEPTTVKSTEENEQKS
ncbi:GATA zinc finger domain-containing protein 14 isoform X2 [Tetranychus urticae]|uniref:GATA zinc finger domain-containing protein 14 isoform X2 n=1 Tax=Tetranychus urticae TaxID=32264 RepID=UPI00077B98F6|nr:GATA zinc finger domain-containing protein 14 isoform X2 [Tetranychus urticae]